MQTSDFSLSTFFSIETYFGLKPLIQFSWSSYRLLRGLSFSLIPLSLLQVMRSNETEILVVVLGKDERWTEIAIEIVTELWEGKVKAEFACVAAGKIAQQITRAATSGIPWLAILGEDELKAGILRLRNIAANSQEDVKRENLVAELQRRVGSV